MFLATATIESIPGSPYSASRKHSEPKKDKESHADYEERTWREKGYYTDDTPDGEMYIPPMSFKNAIAATAQLLQLVIPGKKGQTYGKHFLNGVQCVTPFLLGVTRKNVKGEWFNCHANGKRGSGSRVDRCFPMVNKWGGKLELIISNSIITKDIFLQVLRETGNLNGVGRFRPAQGGLNGRFVVKDLKWVEYTG